MQRVNIRITDELHAYYKAQSEKTGVAMAALMLLDLQAHREQKEMMESLPKMYEFIEKLEQREKYSKDNQS